MADVRDAGHEVTIYNWLGEDDDGIGRYASTVVRNMTFLKNEGVQQYPARTLEGNDRAVAYFHMETCQADGGREFLPWKDFQALEDHSGHWSISTDGKDRIVACACNTPSPPDDKNQDVYRPIAVTDNTRMGSAHMRHLRVICR